MKSTGLFGLLILTSVFSLVSCNKDESNSEEVKNDFTAIYFQDSYNETIENLPINGGEPVVVAEGIYGVGIVYDKTNESIYYSTLTDDDNGIPGKIWKADADGKNAVVIATDIYDPMGIDLDSKNNKIYWGDDDGNVSRSNLDGSGKENVVTIDGGGIRAVAVDETNGKLYFYDVSNDNLYQSNLDGSSMSVIIEGYYGYAIAVDEKNNKIYFEAQNQLYRANLDGTNMVLIDDTQSRIYGIAIDTYNNKIYWSTRDNYEIYSANLNGTNKKTLNTFELGSPRGIFLKY